MELKRGRLTINILFFSILTLYLAIGSFLNMSYVFSIPGLVDIWRPNSYIVNLVMGLVGFLGTFFLLMARRRVPAESIERRILLLVALTSLFFGSAGLSMGIIEGMGGGEAFTHSALTLENIIPPFLFLLSVVTGVWAIVIMINNSCAIFSRAQLLVTIVISVLVFAGLGVLSVVTAGIELTGLMKAAVLFFSAVCLAAVAAMTFVIMAFRRGRGRTYWISMATGIMLIALSGLGALFCYAIGGKWVGMALLGFTAAMALLAYAGIRRWMELA
ncbi:hypothetical protein GF359_05500 [candidate division WOR-3 bacterium]|uniref:Uncharacterized protein n=1 Tax=candidate division WOR-3 bacterium TaxID=2052148 RepID=A0A9D5K952_UNCW3|nr:hypothetical protein [candidate division WOR-3 bacterium]MBD3364651.1 hypothetical protein [candidate division WOR-3 bacterium]